MWYKFKAWLGLTVKCEQSVGRFHGKFVGKEKLVSLWWFPSNCLRGSSHTILKLVRAWNRLKMIKHKIPWTSKMGNVSIMTGKYYLVSTYRKNKYNLMFCFRRFFIEYRQIY